MLTLNSFVGGIDLIFHCLSWIICVCFCILYTVQYYRNVTVVKRTNDAFMTAQAECTRQTNGSRLQDHIGKSIQYNISTSTNVNSGEVSISRDHETDDRSAIDSTNDENDYDNNKDHEATRVLKLPFYTYQYSKHQILILKYGLVSIFLSMVGITLTIIDKWINVDNMDKWETNKLKPLMRIGFTLIAVSNVVLRWTLIEILNLTLDKTAYQLDKWGVYGLRILLIMSWTLGLILLWFYSKYNVSGKYHVLYWVIPLGLSHFIFYFAAGFVHTKKFYQITKDISKVGDINHNNTGINRKRSYNYNYNCKVNKTIVANHKMDLKNTIGSNSASVTSVCNSDDDEEKLIDDKYKIEAERDLDEEKEKEKENIVRVKKRVEKMLVHKMVKFALIMGFIIFFVTVTFTTLVLTVVLHLEPAFVNMLGSSFWAMGNIIGMTLLAPFSMRYYQLCCHICHISIAKCFN